MKRFDAYLFYTLSVALLTVAFLSGSHHTPKHKHQRLDPAVAVTVEQRATHLIRFKDKDGEDFSGCTGTAIGPHALLTAEHCIIGVPTNLVTFDMAMEPQRIIIDKTVFDGRDHVILTLSGNPFKNYLHVEPATELRVGETLTYYGDGGWVYPPQPKFGKVTNCNDPSDIDADAGIFCSTNQAISGDSGSALYNTKGQIVGLLTWVVLEDDTHTSTESFALHFTKAQYDAALAFDGKP